MATRTPRLIAFIPARGGSKGIPHKNIRMVAGRPLIHYALEAAVSSESIDLVVVSTDADEIRDVVRAFESDKVELISRSPESATDTATTESAMLEFAETRDFDDIVLIQATSPVLSSEHLDAGLKIYKNSGATSLLSVVRQKRFQWRVRDDDRQFVTAANYDPLARPRRQEFEGQLVENGAFYITNRSALLESRCRVSGDIGWYEMPESSYFEIDEPEDLEIVEALVKRGVSKSSGSIDPALLKLKVFLTDVDGVLTDAGMYYTEAGDELKKFNTRDGMAFEMLREMGLVTGIITGEDTSIVARRAAKLRVDHVFQGVNNKLAVLRTLLRELDVSPQEVAYVGDDINDLGVMSLVGFAVAPADAIPEVRARAHYVSRAPGGGGCVREAVELIKSALRANSHVVYKTD